MEGITQIDFIDGQRAPEVGEELDLCLCFCGARYVGGKDFHQVKSGVFHFKGGWRE
jgi:hypothetical protein